MSLWIFPFGQDDKKDAARDPELSCSLRSSTRFARDRLRRRHGAG